MKKIISMLLISTLLASSLTACNNESGSSASDADSSDTEAVDNSGLPYPDTRAGSLTKAVLALDSWPGMDLVTDQNVVEIMFSSEFDLEKCDEYCFATNIISAQLYKAIIIKPAEGGEDDVRTAMDNYLNAVKTNPDIAFYPGQQENAEGAVTGKTDDGYLYLIVHKNGSDIADAIKSDK